MGHCEYHEFQAIDAALTRAQRERASALSSRAYVTSQMASYEHHYSSFRGDPYTLLADCFDAMLYMTSYGERQLMFRFPLGLLDQKRVSSFAIEGAIECSETKSHLILNLYINDEENRDWIEGEGWLDELVDLRRELLEGDFRCLYLFWLKDAEQYSSWAEYQEEDEEEEEIIEPPIPPGLGALSPAQKMLVKFLELDVALVKAAALQSASLSKANDQQLALSVPLLSDAEKLDFLQRLSREEPGLALKLNHRLRKLSSTPTSSLQAPESGPSIHDLQQAAEDIKERQKTEKRLAREKEREAYLRGLSENVEALWKEVDDLIQTMQSKKYDKAVSLLLELRDLAALEDELEPFQERFQELVKDYSSRYSLLRKMRDAELLD